MQSVSYVDCHNLAYYSDLAVLCVMLNVWHRLNANVRFDSQYLPRTLAYFEMWQFFIFDT